MVAAGAAVEVAAEVAEEWSPWSAGVRVEGEAAEAGEVLWGVVVAREVVGVRAS